mgnify:CR=1 FL=1
MPPGGVGRGVVMPTANHSSRAGHRHPILTGRNLAPLARQRRQASLDRDILRVGVHHLSAGDILRVRGQDSGPRRRRTPPAGRTRTRPRGMSPPARRGAGTTKRHRDQEPPRPGTAERTVLTVWQHRAWHSHGTRRRTGAGLRRRARSSTGTNRILNLTQLVPAHPVPALRGTETKRT